MRFFVFMFLAAMLSACSLTEVAADKIGSYIEARCANASPAVRAEWRQEVAAECDGCEAAIRCPGETWDEVLAPLN